jgi:hypothetical protein
LKIDEVMKTPRAKITIFISILTLIILFTGCIQFDSKDKDSSSQWQSLDSGSGRFYSGTVSIQVSLPKWLDEETFLLPSITADNKYHYVSTWIILNTGTHYVEIMMEYDGEMFLSKYNETGQEIQRLSVGEKPEINDISMKVFIDGNSTENENCITMSEEASEEIFTIVTALAPGDEIPLHFYVKSHNETIFGKYKSIFNMEFTVGATTEPISNPEFKLFDIKGNELIFDLDFVLVLSSHISIGDIKISCPNDPLYPTKPIKPNPTEKNNYNINIKLPVKGDIGQYPLDTYTGAIELNAVDDNYTKVINSTLNQYFTQINTTTWLIQLSSEGNRIYFNFERNHEQNVFYFIKNINDLLIIIGIVVISLNIIFAVLLNYRNSLFAKSLSVISIFPWISLIFFGLNYITFYSPAIDTYGNSLLINRVIILFGIIIVGKILEKEGEKEMNLFSKSTVEMLKYHLKRKRIFIIFNIISIVTLFILFWFFRVKINNVITIMLTYVLVMATGHYALVNSNIFKMMEEDRRFNIKPDFAWRFYKDITQDNTSKNKTSIDFYLYLRNIGRGSAKEIDLDILLTGDHNNQRKYGHGKIILNPMISNEETWIHVEPPVSIDDNSQSDTFLAGFMFYNDANEDKHHSSPLRNIGSIEIITKKQKDEIYKLADANLCKLQEISEDTFRSITESCNNNIQRIQ